MFQVGDSKTSCKGRFLFLKSTWNKPIGILGCVPTAAVVSRSAGSHRLDQGDGLIIEPRRHLLASYWRNTAITVMVLCDGREMLELVSKGLLAMYIPANESHV